MRSITRKEFLKTTAVGSFALLPLNLTGNYISKNENNGVTVGAHPWVYAAKLPNYDITPRLEQIFADMSYAGMDGVELMHHPLRSFEATERIGELKEEHSLPVIGTSYGADMWNREKYAEILEEAETIIINLAKVGGRTLGASVGNTGGMKTSDQLDAQAELLRKLIGICEDNDVVLNLHNHTYEVENNLHDLNGTLERLPNAKLGPDLNWLIRGGVSPIDFIHQYGEKIVFLHLRDQNAKGRWMEYLGQGSTDFTAIADALKKFEFSGDAIIELAHERDFERTMPLRDSLKMSREFVQIAMGY